MEHNFTKVHTTKDIIFSIAVLLIGVALIFASPVLGAVIVLCAALMFFLLKSGYRAGGQGAVLVRKAVEISSSCRQQITDYLGGKDVALSLTEAGQGPSVRVEIFFNKEESVAYVELYDFSNYSYVKALGPVRLDGVGAKTFMDSVLCCL